MKHRYFAVLVTIFILMAGCDNAPIHSSLRPVLPVPPEDWQEILGAPPSWRLEWIGDEGTWQEWTGASGSEVPTLSLVQEWTTPVLAWPFWPEWDLAPGIMKPAGALFPLDAAGEQLNLTWKGGIEAVFWKEMATACGSDDGGGERFPWLFDWPRFREILASDGIPEAVSEDLWLVDWRELAKKTAQSGFDRRRITPKDFTEITIPGLEGRWVGSSPFALPLDASTEDSLYLKVTDNVGTWVSSDAILKCSRAGWVLRER